MNYVVFDIGGTNIKYSVMNEKCDFLESHKIETPKQGKYKTQEEIVRIINEFKLKYDIEGVALSVPGGINDDLYIHFMGQVVDLENMNLRDYIKEHTGLNSTYDNDVNCVALAEKFKGNAVDNSNFLCITIGTGIGGAIFINDKLYRGKNGLAGEFGMCIIENENSQINNLGNKSVSRLSSTYNLIDRVKNIKKDFCLDGEAVFELANKGDNEVINEIENFYFNLAITIYNLSYSFAPEKILIGGGISERKDLIENINKKLEIINPNCLKFIKLEVCKFKNDSGQIGALYKYLNE